MLERILFVLGASTVAVTAAGGCNSRLTTGDGGSTEKGDGDGDGDGTHDMGTGDGDGDGAGDGDGDGDGDGSPPILDVHSTGDGDGDGDGVEGCDFEKVWSESTPPLDCDNGEGGFEWMCFPPPAGTSCEEEPYTDECLLSRYSCGLVTGGDEIACGPIETDVEECCYGVRGGCAVGRPLLIEGVARVAAVEQGGGWSSSLRPDVSSLEDGTRRALADLWTHEGLAEHASVASFSRFVMQLLVVGAPSDLLVQAQQAIADEIEHARVCFGLASAYAGRSLRPTELDVLGALSAASLEREAIAVSLASEGCIAETVSAMLVAAARERATDPVVIRELARIAEQEADHAALAWQALAWILERSSAHVRETVAVTFAQAHQHFGIGAVTSRSCDRERLADHGFLSPEERRKISHDVLDRVVRPAATTLLAGRGPDLRGRMPPRKDATPSARF